MAVLHILLGILKIAGILLAVLLGLLSCCLSGSRREKSGQSERKPENFVAVSWNFFKSMV